MQTILQPRWLLLKTLAITAIDDASEHANRLLVDDAATPPTTKDAGVSILIHLGKAESAVEWMAELLSQYKSALDHAAVALQSVYKDGGYGDEINKPLEAAVDALGALQEGYLDDLWVGGKPGV